MKNKSILIITSEFPPKPGGIGNHAYNVSNILCKYFNTVSVICDQRSTNVNVESDFDKNLNFDIIRIRLKSIRILMYLNRFFTTLKHIKKNNIIIATGKFSLWLTAFASLIFRNKKYLAVIHGSEVNFKKYFLRKSIEYSLGKFHQIIAVSNFTKSLISHLNFSNISVIPNGFDITDMSNVKINNIEGYPSLITVGSVSDRKGQLNVIEALPYLVDLYPNLHYHIVGTPYKKDQFLRVARRLGVQKHITFHGLVDDKTKIYLLKNSDIFIMLSQKTISGDVEGFGIAILEANSLQIPSIGSKNCGIEDAIKNNFSGILVNPKSFEEISNAVENILNNHDNFKKNSLEWSLNFTWDKIGLLYVDLINKCFSK